MADGPGGGAAGLRAPRPHRAAQLAHLHTRAALQTGEKRDAGVDVMGVIIIIIIWFNIMSLKPSSLVLKNDASDVFYSFFPSPPLLINCMKLRSGFRL